MTRAEVEAAKARQQKASLGEWQADTFDAHAHDDVRRLTIALLAARDRIKEQDELLDALQEAMNPQDMAEALDKEHS